MISAYNEEKYGIMSIGCRQKKGQVVQKTPAIRGGVIFFVAFAGPACVKTINVAFGE
jgi:hypothetical protein